MSKKDVAAVRTRCGFTLVELIVVIVIIGILSAVIAPRVLSRVGQSKQSVAKSNAAALASAMRSFAIDNGAPAPGTELDVLWTKPDAADDEAWQGPYVNSQEDLIDPWGNAYVLVIPPEVHADFDIVSYGRDAKPGGEGEDADIIEG